jgi:hypothetical protein
MKSKEFLFQKTFFSLTLIFLTFTSISGQIASPQNLRILYFPDSTVLNWDGVADINLSGYEIHSASKFDTTASVKIADLNSSKVNFIIPEAAYKFYWVKAKGSASDVSYFSKGILPSLSYAGLIGYWPFDGNANDASGNAVDTWERNGPTYVTDRFGKSGGAVKLDGVDDYIQVDTGVFFTGDFTFSGWVNIDNNVSPSRFFDFGNGQGVENVLFYFSGSGSQDVHGYVTNSYDNSWNGIYKNIWHFITFIQRGTYREIYVDNVFVASWGGTNTSYPHNVVRNRNYFGKSNWSGESNFNGKFDDICIFNRAISRDEINNLFTGKVDKSFQETDFGRVTSGTKKLAYVVNNSGANAAWFTLSGLQSPYSADSAHIFIPAGSTDTVLINYTPSAKGTYTDTLVIERDDHISPVKRAIFKGSNPTIKSGVVTTNTVWTKANSPYFLTNGGLAVDPGVKLTIEPGVEVVIDSSSQFIVYGELNAIGTSADPIKYTNDDDDAFTRIYIYQGKAFMSWFNIENGAEGIRAYNSQVWISDAVINKCNYAIILDNSEAHLDKINASSGYYEGLYALNSSYGEIKNSSFANFLHGIHFVSSSSMQVLNNTITNSRGTGITIENNYQKAVEGNTTTGNYNGYYVYNCYSFNNNTTSNNYNYGMECPTCFGKNNISRNNGSTGLRLWSSSNLVSGISEGNPIGLQIWDNCTADGMIIRNNTGKGVELSSNSTLKSCIISSNGSYGIEAYDWNTKILKNRITANTGFGIKANADGITIQNNDIVGNNSDGIYTFAKPVVNFNNIFDNKGYDFNVQRVVAGEYIDASNNYWGTSVLDTVYSHTFDGSDVISYTRLTLTPLKTSMVVLADSVREFIATPVTGDSVLFKWSPMAKAKEYYLFSDNKSGIVDTVAPFATVDSSVIFLTRHFSAGNYKFAIRAKTSGNTLTRFTYVLSRACSTGGVSLNIQPFLPRAVEGQALDLNATLNLSATFQWQIGDAGGWKNLTDQAGISGTNASTLHFAQVADSLMLYNLRAIATSACGIDSSSAVTIEVDSIKQRNVIINRSDIAMGEVLRDVPGTYHQTGIWLVNKANVYASVDSISGLKAPFELITGLPITIAANDSAQLMFRIPKDYSQGFYANDLKIWTGSKAFEYFTNNTSYKGFYNGHYYYLTNSGINARDAKLLSLKTGVGLAAINSAAENANLAVIVPQDFFFGYSDEIAEGQWKWLNGDTTSYSKWYSGQPDNGGGNEDYAVLYHGWSNYWNDAPGSGQYLFEMNQSPWLQTTIQAQLRNSSPRFEISSNTIDFGTMKPSDSNNPSATLYIKNMGDSQLNIDSLAGIKAPYSHNLTFPIHIAAGDSVPLLITFKRNGSNGSHIIYPSFYTNDSLYYTSFNTNIATAYPLDGNASDISGNNLNGTLSNTASTSDLFFKPGKAIEFNGNSSCITAGNPIPAKLQIQKEISLSAWIYLKDYPSDMGQIAGSLTYSPYWWDPSRGIGLYIDGRINPDGHNAPKGHIHFNSFENNVSHPCNTSTAIPLNQWVHVVATRKAGEYPRIYFNGVLQPSQSDNTWQGNIDYSNTLFTIGAEHRTYYGDNVRFFKGSIDEVKVYNTQLPAEQVQGLYHYRAKTQLELKAYLNYIPIPANFAAQYFKNEIQLSWDSVQSADLAGYRIFRSENADTLTSAAIFTTSASAKTYIDNSISPEKSYYYWVKAVDTANFESNFSQIVQTSASPVTNVGLVAWLPFNGSTLDESGNGFNGIISGATPTTNRFGAPNSAYSFDNNSDNIILANTSDKNLENGFTLAAWILDQNPQRYYVDSRIISKYDGNGFFLSDYSYYYYYYYLTLWCNGNRLQTDESNYNNGNWHFVVGTYDAGVDTFKLYVDGILKKQAFTPYNTFSSSPIQIGGSFIGKIDDVRLYDRPVSLSEVTDLYQEIQSSMNFGSVAVSTAHQQKINVNNPAANSVVYNVTNHGAPYTPSTSTLTVPANSSDSLMVTFLPTVLGSFNDTVYLEPQDHSAPVIRLTLSGNCVTPICGIIGTDSTWTKTHSPYYLNCAFGIDNGATLTVEPGVEIIVDGSTQINIDGKLNVNGTNAEPVKFVSLTSNNLINLKNGNLNMNHYSINGANTAIYATGGGSSKINLQNGIITSCSKAIDINNYVTGSISGNTLTNNGLAIKLSNCSVDISGNTIENNTGWGISIDNNNSGLIKNNLVASNDAGIYCQYAATSTNTIRNNRGIGLQVYYSSVYGDTIDSNNGVGLWFYGYSSTTINSVVVSNNQGDGIFKYYGYWSDYSTINNSYVSGNTGIGINGTFFNVNNTIVKDNAGGGIYSDYSNTRLCKVENNGNNGVQGQDLVLYSNSISNNLGNGVFLTNTNRSGLVTYNDIFNNGTDGILMNSLTTLNYNNIWGNTGYNVHATKTTSSTDTINAQFNFWQLSTLSQIGAKIYDYYDDGATAKVYLGGISNAEVQLQHVTGFNGAALANSNIELTWEKHPKAFQYYIYNDQGTGYVDTIHIWQTVSSLSTSFKSILPDALYTFGIRPVAYNGNPGYVSFSNPVELDGTPPSLSSVFGFPSDTVIKITFTENIDPASVKKENFIFSNGISIKNISSIQSDSINATLTGFLPNVNVSVKLNTSGISDPIGNTRLADSIVFYVDNGNHIPSVSLNNIPGQVSRDITIYYSISDYESDVINLVADYSTDLGKTWNTATVTGNLNNITSSLYSGSIVWNSYTDIPGVTRKYVLFRLTPSDSNPHTSGTPGRSNYLTIDNNVGPVATIPSIIGKFDHDVSISFSLFDQEGDSIQIIPEYYDDISKTWKTATVAGITSGLHNGSSSVTWKSFTDVPTDTSAVDFRVTPYDAKQGTADTVNLIIDNVGKCAVQFTNTLPSEISGFVTFDYIIFNSNTDSVTLKAEYSYDGQNWNVPALNKSLVNIGPSNYTGSFIWNTNSNFPSLDLAKVFFRITPNNGNDGIGKTFNFHIDNNLPPSVTLQPVNGLNRGTVTFNYTLSDSESDNLKVKLLFEKNGVWDTCTVTGAASGITPAYYANRIIVWNNHVDMPGADGIYRVCMIPLDKDAGNADTINVWVNNLPKVELGNSRQICGNANTTLDAGDYFKYQWNTADTSRTITVANSGTFYVNTIDSFGTHYYSDTVQIGIYAVPTVELGPGIYQCGGTRQLDAGNFVAYDWSTGETSRTITVNSKDNYKVKVTDNHGCFNYDSVFVNIQKPVTEQICFVAADDSLDQNVVAWQKTYGNGTAEYKVYRDTSAGQKVFVGSRKFNDQSYFVDPSSFPGQMTYNYSLTVVDSCGNESPLSTAHSSMFLKVVKLADGYNLEWTAYAGRNVDRYEIYRGTTKTNLVFIKKLLASNLTYTDRDPIIDSACVLFYQVRAIFSDACGGSYKSFTSPVSNIASNGAEPALPVIAGKTSLCGGESTTLQLTNSFQSYLWSDGSAAITKTVNTPGTYSVKVVNQFGCKGESAPFTVEVFARPQFSLGNDTTICGNQPLTLKGPAGVESYVWSTGSLQQGIAINKEGTYSLTVTDIHGCSNNDDIIVFYSTIPRPNIASNYYMCPQGQVELDAGNFASYRWSKSVDTVTTIISTTRLLNVDTIGFYTITVRDEKGCENSAEARVLHYATPKISMGPDRVICSGQSTLIEIDTMQYIEWNSGSTSRLLFANLAGNYFITKAQDIHGCSRVSDTLAVKVNPLPDFYLGNDTAFCSNTPYELRGPDGMSSYKWSTNETSQKISVHTASLYTLKATDQNGCSNTDEIFVNFNALPQIPLTTLSSICDNGSNVVLDAGDYVSFLWNTGAVSRTISTNIAGNYSVTVTDVVGCKNTASTRVGYYNTLPITLGNDAAVCAGQTYVLDAGAMLSYNWSDGTKTQTLPVSKAGQYWLDAVDLNGCKTKSDTVYVAINALPAFDLGPDTTLCGLARFTINGPNGSGSYSWKDGPAQKDLTITTSGLYTLSFKDLNGCSFTDTRFVQLSSMPVINLNAIEYICNGDEGLLDPGEFASYNWESGSATVSTSRVMKVSTPQDFNLTVTGFEGCSAFKQIIVQSKSSVSKVSLGADTSFCQYDSVIIRPKSNYMTYNWSDGSNRSHLAVRDPGQYILQAIDLFRCKSSDTIEVSMLAAAAPVDLGSGHKVCYGTAVKLDAGIGYNGYHWNTGALGQVIYADTTGTYWVDVTAGNGCKTRSSASVEATVPYSDQELCVVTVDEAGKNLVVWERPTRDDIVSYNIYKESTTANTFDLLGNVPYSSISQYTDLWSDPHKRADQYRITVNDTCGNESLPSQAHKTMHLTINLGVDSSFNLIWEPYQGLDIYTYYIYRGLSASSTAMLDSVPSSITTYTDLPADPGNYYYQIAAKLPKDCAPLNTHKASSGPYAQAYSNKESKLKSTGTGIFNPYISGVSVFPNPFIDRLKVGFELASSNSITIELTDLTGRVLMLENQSNLSPGYHVLELETTSKIRFSGAYQVKIRSKDFVIIKQIIKM